MFLQSQNRNFSKKITKDSNFGAFKQVTWGIWQQGIAFIIKIKIAFLKELTKPMR